MPADPSREPLAARIERIAVSVRNGATPPGAAATQIMLLFDPKIAAALATQARELGAVIAPALALLERVAAHPCYHVVCDDAKNLLAKIGAPLQERATRTAAVIAQAELTACSTSSSHPGIACAGCRLRATLDALDARGEGGRDG